jgi:hypothetical protein
MKPPVKSRLPREPPELPRHQHLAHTAQGLLQVPLPWPSSLSGIEKKISAALPTLSAATAQKAPRQPMKGSSASSGADAVTAPSAPQDMM